MLLHFSIAALRVFPSIRAYISVTSVLECPNISRIKYRHRYFIRDFLGHVDCATTEIYARADTEMKRKAIEAAYVDVLPQKELPSWTDDKNLMGFLNSLGL